MTLTNGPLTSSSWKESLLIPTQSQLPRCFQRRQDNSNSKTCFKNCTSRYLKSGYSIISPYLLSKNKLQLGRKQQGLLRFLRPELRTKAQQCSKKRSSFLLRKAMLKTGWRATSVQPPHDSLHINKFVESLLSSSTSCLGGLGIFQG